MKIKDFTIVTAGQSAPQSASVFSSIGTPFIRAGSLEELCRTGSLFNLERISEENAIQHKLRLFPEDTVIFAKSGMSAKIGRVYKLSEPSYLTSHLAAILPSNRHNSDYIKYFFQIHSPSQLIPNDSYPSIKLSELEKFEIPLPPLDEQERIASILDQADYIIQKRKESLQLADDYIKSVFLEMFGDPVTNPMGWDIAEVIKFCDCMVPGRDKPKSFTGNIPWITIDDLNINSVTCNSKKGLGLTHSEIAQVKRKTIPQGSVIMSCVGNLGICSIAGTEMIINQQLHSFQCKSEINNLFLMYYLGQRTDYMKAHATNTTVLYMNKTTCNNIPTICPPINLQNKFAQIVEQVEKTKEEMKSQLNEAETLFKALQQQFFG